MATSQGASNSRAKLADSAKRQATGLLLRGAGRRVRSIVIIICAAVLLQLLYGNVWWQLHQDVPLPAAIATEPQGATAALDSIAAQRTRRLERTPRTFAPFGPLFVPAATTAAR